MCPRHNTKCCYLPSLTVTLNLSEPHPHAQPTFKKHVQAVNNPTSRRQNEDKRRIETQKYTFKSCPAMLWAWNIFFQYCFTVNRHHAPMTLNNCSVHRTTSIFSQCWRWGNLSTFWGIVSQTKANKLFLIILIFSVALFYCVIKFHCCHTEMSHWLITPVTKEEKTLLILVKGHSETDWSHARWLDPHIHCGWIPWSIELKLMLTCCVIQNKSLDAKKSNQCSNILITYIFSLYLSCNCIKNLFTMKSF